VSQAPAQVAQPFERVVAKAVGDGVVAAAAAARLIIRLWLPLSCLYRFDLVQVCLGCMKDADVEVKSSEGGLPAAGGGGWQALQVGAFQGPLASSLIRT
jgi:hypothetical protein